MYVSKRVQLGQWATSLWKIFDFLILRVYVRLLISDFRFLFLSLSLYMNVCSSVQLCYDWLYVDILLFFALVTLFLSEYPY